MKKEQLKIGVILSYVSMALNMLVELLYTPVMIHLLGQSEYGLYTLVGSVVSYLSLFSLGFTGAYIRFYSRYKNQNNKKSEFRLNGMFLTLFLILSACAVICGFILLQFPEKIFGKKLASDELNLAQTLMMILIVNIALSFPDSLMNSIISAHEQFFVQRIISIIGTVINPFIALPLLLLGYGSVAVVSVTTFITVVKFFINIWYCITKLKIKFYFDKFDFALFKEMGFYSFFIFLNMIIDQINWNVDKLILGHVGGTNSVAVYGVASTINSTVMTFSTAISSVFAPRVHQMYLSDQVNSNKTLTDLMIKVGRIQFIVLGVVMTGFVIFGKFFITDIYAGKEYDISYYVALFLILPLMIPLCQNLGIEIQRAMNKHQFRSVIYIIMALVNVCISIPLASKFGAIGTAMGTCISLIVSNGLIMNIYYHKALKLNMFYFWKNILKIVPSLVIPVCFGFFVISSVTFNDIVQYLLYIILYTVIYAACVYKFGMNSYEKDLLFKAINKLKRRKRKPL